MLDEEISIRDGELASASLLLAEIGSRNGRVAGRTG